MPRRFAPNLEIWHSEIAVSATAIGRERGK
jgi:hypothetical protein